VEEGELVVEERELVVVPLRVLFLFAVPCQVSLVHFFSLGGWGFFYTLLDTDVRQFSPRL